MIKRTNTKRSDVKWEKVRQMDLLLALQAQADPPPTFPKTQKHRDHEISQQSPKLSHQLLHQCVCIDILRPLMHPSIWIKWTWIHVPTHLHINFPSQGPNVHSILSFQLCLWLIHGEQKCKRLQRHKAKDALRCSQVDGLTEELVPDKIFDHGFNT